MTRTAPSDARQSEPNPLLTSFRLNEPPSRPGISANSLLIDALHSGDAGLGDMPDELMASDAGGARQEWLEDRLTPASREWLDGRKQIASKLRLLVDAESEGGSVTAEPHGGDH